jgi:hypothetical protein
MAEFSELLRGSGLTLGRAELLCVVKIFEVVLALLALGDLGCVF